MKRFLRLALLVTLVAAICSVLPGCGSDTKQAREYMRRGDDKVRQLQDEAQQWQAEVSELMKNVPDPATYAAAIDRAKSSANDLSRTAGVAKDRFEKIRGLSGVDDYVKYAELQIKALEKFQELISRTNAFFDQVVAMVNAGDITGMTTAQGAYETAINRLGQEIGRLDEESQNLKADREL